MINNMPDSQTEINNDDTSSSWYEEWFDSSLYEKLYAYRDDEEAARLADLLEVELPNARYRKILDLGCGRGRHSLNMARRGYKVTGFDLSERAIQKARDRAENENLSIDFRIHDMREPLDEQFDAILNLFTTFGYFDDDAENVRVLHAMSHMLRPSGRLVIDYMNAHGVRRSLDPHQDGSIESLGYDISKEIDESVNMVVKTIRFHKQDGDVREYQERVKLYDLDWFKEHLARYNLALVKCCGNYDGDPYEEEVSNRLLMFICHQS
ncbi:MAG TPA: class I SAM-dependent methyltransferase [Balneolales bacterium]|nr:class I SAM-dependent methyltransferase [Balneolales bacterium]